MENEIKTPSWLKGISSQEYTRILKSITEYRKAGISVELLEGNVVKITQERNFNNLLLSNKELYDRAKAIFPGEKVKIIPVLLSVDMTGITPEWLVDKMNEFGVRPGDLVKQLGITKAQVSHYLSGERGLTALSKAAFYYYFMLKEVNRDLRDQLN